MSPRNGGRKRAGIAVAVALPLLASTAVPQGSGERQSFEGTSEQQLRANAEGAFGFRLREERRYALGPPGILGAGESEQWIIRLESIDDEPASLDETFPGRRVRFHLEHEATQVARNSGLFGGDTMTAFHGIMALTVNEFGFPLRASYEADRDDPRVLGGREETTLVFDGNEFRILNPYRMGFRELGLGIPSGRFIDLSVPRGAYLAGYENPGLYSLVIAGAGIQEAGEVEYVAVAPSLFAGSGDRRQQDGVVVSRAWLRFVDHTFVNIGGARTPAMRLRRSSGGELYVREDGTVLRVDITISGGRDAWLRLLRPSEY